MDKDLENLFEENEGRQFTLCNHNFMIHEGKLCIETEKDGYLPIDAGNVLLIKVWGYLLHGK